MFVVSQPYPIQLRSRMSDPFGVEASTTALVVSRLKAVRGGNSTELYLVGATDRATRAVARALTQMGFQQTYATLNPNPKGS